jgi:hypothetical protein
MVATQYTLNLGGATRSDGATLYAVGEISADAAISGHVKAGVGPVNEINIFTITLRRPNQADLSARSGIVNLTLDEGGYVSGTITSDLPEQTLSIAGNLVIDCYAQPSVEGGFAMEDPTFSSPHCKPLEFLLATKPLSTP